jgi:UDP-N-acetylmuramoylalanine--D-glutamate ligase
MDNLELRDWRVLVIGLRKSGRSAAAFCAARGARVVAVDEGALESFPDASELQTLSRDVEVRIGVAVPDPAEFDLVVPSPGVPRERYAGRARRVWGDIELAYRALRIPIVAVTGTNGKSTTTRLIEAMLRAAGLRARAAGNIGTPALSLVGEPLDAAVLEVSSFQLETVERFRPRVAVILNVTPDHLDRHGSFDAYVEAKAVILRQQQPEDVAVLNFDDPVLRGLASRARARVIPISRTTPLAEGVTFDGGSIRLRSGGTSLEIPADVHALPGLRGVHNLENILASFAAVSGLGADPRRAAAALLDFPGLPHRCEEVAHAGGVTFVDDSKATNTGAAERSLESFPQPVLWIAGGRGKGTDLAALAALAAVRARHAFLIGESAGAIEAALAGRVPVTRCASIEEAVSAAGDAARDGDVVLLAPACASFDQFANYEERGERFALAARRWAASRTGAAGPEHRRGGAA